MPPPALIHPSDQLYLPMDRLNLNDTVQRLVIALDFGTTFSGISYAFASGDDEEVRSILDWPGLEGHSQPKVPTTICYDPQDPRKFTWGGQRHHGDVIEGVKLLLDPEQERPIYLPKPPRLDLASMGKTPVDVAADYIGAIYNHALRQIAAGVPEGYVETCKKDFVLTVPAVWSDKAKNLTMLAAKQAGIHPVTLVKEPEAAAMYTLHALKEKKLAIGDAFTLVDAGGGTVDLISYEITSLVPRLELREVVPSKGGMAGSLGLNRRFEAEVKELVGEDEYVRVRKTKGYKAAVNQFDKDVKRSFHGDLDDDYYINFPLAGLRDDPNNNLESNCWNMTGRDVKVIFDPLITDIERMVQDQVNMVEVKRASEPGKPSSVKAICLVGGFGSNEYLKSRIEENHPGIHIIRHPDAWSSIARGAVLHNLPKQAQVVSSLAQRHYGIAARSLWNKFNNSHLRKEWDATRGQWMVTKMSWHIALGEELKRDEFVKLPFNKSLREDYTDDQLIFTFRLMESRSKIQPTYPTASTIMLNCILTTDLRSVDPINFTIRTGHDGYRYFDVHFHLVVTLQTAVMKFALEIDGREMGSVNASYA